jgi:hypothetical protein
MSAIPAPFDWSKRLEYNWYTLRLLTASYTQQIRSMMSRSIQVHTYVYYQPYSPQMDHVDYFQSQGDGFRTYDRKFDELSRIFGDTAAAVRALKRVGASF